MLKPNHFIHDSLSSHIVFGTGTLSQLPSEAAKLGMKRVLILTTPHQAEQGKTLQNLLGNVAAGLFCEARMHTPTDVTEKACALVQELACDGVVAIGGGSTTGLAKAIALRTNLPQIVIPTTYAGSEVTPIIGETQAGEKITQRSEKVIPETVIYDVELTQNMPISLTVTSGFNAIAHAAEALYSPNISPITALLAEEGVRAMVKALTLLTEDPHSLEARQHALYSAWLCGVCLGTTDMALHHKLCHTLGGSFDLPHAETHTVMLPHVLAYNLKASDFARERLTRAVGSDDPALALHKLAKKLAAPTSLSELGMPETGIAKAAKMAVSRPYPNPRSFDEHAILTLIQAAWSGHQPTGD